MQRPELPDDLDQRPVDADFAARVVRMLLRSQADHPDPSKVDRDQLNAACNWARHAVGIAPVFRHGN